MQPKNRISRRNFLAASLALPAAAASTQFLTGCTPKNKDTYKPVTRFGFTTYTWGKDWDIDTLIANCTKAKAFGVELRTSMSYKHGVELDLTPDERKEVRSRFYNSPVDLVSIACGERYDWPDKDKLAEAIENTKAFIKLSRDIGSEGVRVFPNSFHDGIQHEVTIAQIARSMNILGKFAADYGQTIELEAHGSVGTLPNLHSIMQQVNSPNVKIKLNSSTRDTEGAGFAQNFEMVRPYLGNTLHLHNLKSTRFPYQQQMDLLIATGWNGWQLLEASDKVDNRQVALIEQSKIWHQILANSLEIISNRT